MIRKLNQLLFAMIVKESANFPGARLSGEMIDARLLRDRYAFEHVIIDFANDARRCRRVEILDQPTSTLPTD